MLVYANSFNLNPANGRNAIITLVAGWVSHARGGNVDPQLLAGGIRELKLPNRSTLSSRVTPSIDGKPDYPYYFCARLSHGQDDVPGRLWITEVGIKQETEDDEIQCSVLLETSDVSARVVAPVQVTRPRIVQALVDNCRPAANTPSLNIFDLNEEKASGFLNAIEHPSRRYPIVIISPNKDGDYPVAPERLRSLVVGLAQVVKITPEADTHRIQDIVGRRYIAFRGAINVVFPPRETSYGPLCKNTLIRPEQIEERLLSGVSVETEVMGLITHYTNLPNSWRHTSPEIVGQAILTHRLEKAAASAKVSDESSVYESLLHDASEAINASATKIADLQDELTDAKQSLEIALSEADGLKYALSGVQARTIDVSDDTIEAFVPLREMLVSVLQGTPTLEQSVRMLGTLYPDRVVILDTATSSARESDRNGFRHTQKALGLLLALANGYWQDLAAGKNDQQARAVFGNSFAAKEAQTLSKDGRDCRTFKYQNENFLMEKHLKIGVKDSFSETLRVHFEWLPQEQKIVIGHCGKHLDF